MGTNVILEAFEEGSSSVIFGAIRIGDFCGATAEDMSMCLFTGDGRNSTIY
jgi:hypothetical protein